MSSKDMRFSELKISLINSINKLEEKKFNAMIRNIRKVVDANPIAVKSLSKLLTQNKNEAKSIKLKTIKVGGGRELSKEKSDEALRDMIVIGIFLIIYLGVQIYNYLTRFKVANIKCVKSGFKTKRRKRKDPLSPKPRRRVFSSNAERNSNDPFRI